MGVFFFLTRKFTFQGGSYSRVQVKHQKLPVIPHICILNDDTGNFSKRLLLFSVDKKKMLFKLAREAGRHQVTFSSTHIHFIRVYGRNNILSESNRLNLLIHVSIENMSRKIIIFTWNTEEEKTQAPTKYKIYLRLAYTEEKKF